MDVEKKNYIPKSLNVWVLVDLLFGQRKRDCGL